MSGDVHSRSMWPSPRTMLMRPVGRPALTESCAMIDVGKRRHFGGFQDHRIACRQRRTEFPAGHGQRKIPWRDGADHPIRFRHDHAEVGVIGRDEIAAFLVGEFGEEADLLGRYGDIAGDEMADRDGWSESASSLARGSASASIRSAHACRTTVRSRGRTPPQLLVFKRVLGGLRRPHRRASCPAIGQPAWSLPSDGRRISITPSAGIAYRR